MGADHAIPRQPRALTAPALVDRHDRDRDCVVPRRSRCSVARLGVSASVAADRRDPDAAAASVPGRTVTVTVTRQYASVFGQLSATRIRPRRSVTPRWRLPGARSPGPAAARSPRSRNDRRHRRTVADSRGDAVAAVAGRVGERAGGGAAGQPCASVQLPPLLNLPLPVVVDVTGSGRDERRPSRCR